MYQGRILSKSDFTLGSDCLSKLYYKKLGYPNSKSENSYLSFLAEGGYLIGAAAKLYYPNGVDIERLVADGGLTYREKTNAALEKTREFMLRDRITL